MIKSINLFLEGIKHHADKIRSNTLLPPSPSPFSLSIQVAMQPEQRSSVLTPDGKRKQGNSRILKTVNSTAFSKGSHLTAWMVIKKKESSGSAGSSLEPDVCASLPMLPKSQVPLMVWSESDGHITSKKFPKPMSLLIRYTYFFYFAFSDNIGYPFFRDHN